MPSWKKSKMNPCDPGTWEVEGGIASKDSLVSIVSSRLVELHLDPKTSTE